MAGRLEEALLYHRRVYDCIGLLANARRFDLLDADRQDKPPAMARIQAAATAAGQQQQGSRGGRVVADLFLHARPYLTRAMDAVVTWCVVSNTCGGPAWMR